MTPGQAEQFTWSSRYDGEDPSTPEFFAGIDPLTIQALTTYVGGAVGGRVESARGLLDEAERRRVADPDAVPWWYLHGLMSCCQLMEEVAGVFIAGADLATFGRTWLGLPSGDIRAQLRRWAAGEDIAAPDVARLLGLPRAEDWSGGGRVPVTDDERQTLQGVTGTFAGTVAPAMRAVGRAHARLELLYDKWRHCPAAVTPTRLEMVGGRPWALVAAEATGRKNLRPARLVPLTAAVAQGVAAVSEDAFVLTQYAVHARLHKLSLRDEHAIPMKLPPLPDDLFRRLEALMHRHYSGASATEIKVHHNTENIWVGDPWLTGEDLAAALRTDEWPARPEVIEEP